MNLSKNTKDYHTGGSLLPGRSFSSSTYNFGYQGSLKDDEIAGVTNGHFSTFFREGDTRILCWWSTDPKGSLQPWQSTYSYMDGNPIWFNDPKGDWKPGSDAEGNITVTKEKGDNRRSLYKFFGGKEGMFSKKEVRQMYQGMDKQTGVATLPETIFSRAKQKAISDERPTMEQYESDPSKYNPILQRLGRDYNCWGSAAATARGEELEGSGPGTGVGMRTGEEYDKFLKFSTTSVDRANAVFGKTIIRYAPGGDTEYGNTSHGSIYFGKDRAGNEYTFTKNGWLYAPTISLIKDVELISGYGPVTPLKGNGTSGFYNAVK